MKAEQGYYCLIQYCPDRSRMECANIGVLLFCPAREFLDVRVARDNARIVKFFGEGRDLRRIRSYKTAIVERLVREREEIRSLEDLQHFIASRANHVLLTSPRSISVGTPAEDLERLFQEIVGESAKREAAPNLKKQVASKLLGYGLERKLKRDFDVRIPVIDRTLQVPLGFKNGRFNLLLPERFAAKDRTKIEDRACRRAIQGGFLYRTPDRELGDLQLVVIGEFSRRAERVREVVEGILKEGHVCLYALNELDKLADEIRETAQDLA